MSVGDSPTTSRADTRLDSHLVEDLVVAIQERIATGQFPVGTWLRQERLARELGVSRMPVREALRQLQAIGAVEILANRGARVRLPSVRDIVEVFEIRGLLESHAVAAATRRIDSGQLAELRTANAMFQQVVADLRDAAPGAEVDARPLWYEANSRFHRILIEASGNRNLVATVDMLHRKIPRNLTWLALGNDVRLLARNAEEHAEILAAVDRGHAGAASALVIAHAEHARDLLVSKLDDSGSHR